VLSAPVATTALLLCFQALCFSCQVASDLLNAQSFFGKLREFLLTEPQCGRKWRFASFTRGDPTVEHREPARWTSESIGCRHRCDKVCGGGIREPNEWKGLPRPKRAAPRQGCGLRQQSATMGKSNF